ncbi:choline transporter-like protein 1 [Dreissena polymorpha]|uniref:choline transporter-like protein 1 n=1 Tax=Dreissena polymorpha TaxID=45954 RepID=UPI002263B700|nr:choline transporter-like protein 1 [Dreissena polymorpha]
MAFENVVKPVKENGECSTSAGHDVSLAPKRDRECRDILFLILFAAFMGGMGYVTHRAVTMGNPRRLIYGMDSWGNICNQDNRVIKDVNLSRTGLDLTGKQYLYYFNDNVFTSVIDTARGAIGSIKICVSKCPNEITSVTSLKAFSATSKSQLCVYGVNTSDYFDGKVDGLSDCPHLPIQDHEPFLFRCVPKVIAKKIDHVFDAVKSLLDVIEDGMIEKGTNDIQNSWFEMSLLCGLAVAVALVLTLLLQFMASIIIWLMVVVMVMGGLAATAMCWYHYHSAKVARHLTDPVDRTPEIDRRERDWLIASCAVTGITVLVILVLLAVRKHIKLVVELFRQAGKATRCMPSLLVFPFITLIFLGIFFGGLVYIFLCIETSGTPTVENTTGFVDMKADEILKVLKWYHIFGIVWVTQFIIACHNLTIAGAVSIWYFTRNKDQLGFPVLRSIGNIIRYHIGSLAFGSLVITFVVVLRMVLSFIENRLRSKTHPIALFLLKCLKCCLWCFEQFLKFLSNNAYIEIAIHGYGFCKAARQAFHVIVDNVLRVAAINSVGVFVLFLGKLATVAIVTVAGIEFISVRKNINFVWLPVLLTAIFAYFIASCFMSVYEMTIDTIFICFCEDSLMNDGDTRPYFMSIGLQKCITSRLETNRPTRVEKININVENGKKE